MLNNVFQPPQSVVYAQHKLTFEVFGTNLTNIFIRFNVVRPTYSLRAACSILFSVIRDAGCTWLEYVLHDNNVKAHTTHTNTNTHTSSAHSLHFECGEFTNVARNWRRRDRTRISFINRFGNFASSFPKVGTICPNQPACVDRTSITAPRIRWYSYSYTACIV